MTACTPRVNQPRRDLPKAQGMPTPGLPSSNELPPLAAPRDERLKRPIGGRRTGGPRTAEGRARSALNAIKHGGYVTARSSAVDFQQVLTELNSRLGPIGVVEEGIVNSIALELFRLSTLGKLEVERVQCAVHAEVSPCALAQALDYPWLKTHPDELRNPPSLGVLRARLSGYFASQLVALQSQCVTTNSEPDAPAIEALSLATEDMSSTANDDDWDGTDRHEPAYFDELDRHMRLVACGHKLLGWGEALPADLQPLVDYWLLRNHHRVEAARRELQVEQMVLVLTNNSVRRARSHAMLHLDQCMALLELLRGRPLNIAPNRSA